MQSSQQLTVKQSPVEPTPTKSTDTTSIKEFLEQNKHIDVNAFTIDLSFVKTDFSISIIRRYLDRHYPLWDNDLIHQGKKIINLGIKFVFNTKLFSDIPAQKDDACKTLITNLTNFKHSNDLFNIFYSLVLNAKKAYQDTTFGESESYALFQAVRSHLMTQLKTQPQIVEDLTYLLQKRIEAKDAQIAEAAKQQNKRNELKHDRNILLFQLACLEHTKTIDFIKDMGLLTDLPIPDSEDSLHPFFISTTEDSPHKKYFLEHVKPYLLVKKIKFEIFEKNPSHYVDDIKLINTKKPAGSLKHESSESDEEEVSKPTNSTSSINNQLNSTSLPNTTTPQLPTAPVVNAQKNDVDAPPPSEKSSVPPAPSKVTGTPVTHFQPTSEEEVKGKKSNGEGVAPKNRRPSQS